MIHIAFNLHDPHVIIRLAALVASALAVLCFGMLEFHPTGSKLAKVVVFALLILSFVVIGYSLFALKGA